MTLKEKIKEIEATMKNLEIQANAEMNRLAGKKEAYEEMLKEEESKE